MDLSSLSPPKIRTTTNLERRVSWDTAHMEAEGLPPAKSSPDAPLAHYLAVDLTTALLKPVLKRPWTSMSNLTRRMVVQEHLNRLGDYEGKLDAALKANISPALWSTMAAAMASSQQDVNLLLKQLMRSLVSALGVADDVAPQSRQASVTLAHWQRSVESAGPCWPSNHDERIVALCVGLGDMLPKARPSLKQAWPASVEQAMHAHLELHHTSALCRLPPTALAALGSVIRQMVPVHMKILATLRRTREECAVQKDAWRPKRQTPKNSNKENISALTAPKPMPPSSHRSLFDAVLAGERSDPFYQQVAASSLQGAFEPLQSPADMPADRWTQEVEALVDAAKTLRPAPTSQKARQRELGHWARALHAADQACLPMSAPRALRNNGRAPERRSPPPAQAKRVQHFS